MASSPDPVAAPTTTPAQLDFLGDIGKKPDDSAKPARTLLTDKRAPSEVVRRIDAFAQRRGCTSAQLALAWVLGRGEHLIPIPGTTKIERLEENAAAVEMTLDPTELAALEDAAPKGFAAGLRYDAQRMTMLNL